MGRYTVGISKSMDQIAHLSDLIVRMRSQLSMC